LAQTTSHRIFFGFQKQCNMLERRRSDTPLIRLRPPAGGGRRAAAKCLTRGRRGGALFRHGRARTRSASRRHGRAPTRRRRSQSPQPARSRRRAAARARCSPATSASARAARRASRRSRRGSCASRSPPATAQPRAAAAAAPDAAWIRCGRGRLAGCEKDAVCYGGLGCYPDTAAGGDLACARVRERDAVGGGSVRA
jgi:hypothetical protein